MTKITTVGSTVQTDSSASIIRGFARAYIKDLEKIRPSAIIDIVHSGESLSVKKEVRMPVQGTCERCGFVSSNPVCKACVVLEGLNKGLPRLGIGKTHKERRKMAQMLAAKGDTAIAASDNVNTDKTVVLVHDATSCDCKNQTENKEDNSIQLESCSDSGQSAVCDSGQLAVSDSGQSAVGLSSQSAVCDSGQSAIGDSGQSGCIASQEAITDSPELGASCSHNRSGHCESGHATVQNCAAGIDMLSHGKKKPDASLLDF